jgi:transposase
MRGEHRRHQTMVRQVAPEARVPERYPLRAIRTIVDSALTALDAEFRALHSHTGRPSIHPREYRLRTVLLQILDSVRSDRLRVDPIDFKLLLRGLARPSMDDPVWDHSSLTENRDRPLEAGFARRFVREVVEQARGAKRLSDESFSGDGT